MFKFRLKRKAYNDEPPVVKTLFDYKATSVTNKSSIESFFEMLRGLWLRITG